MRGFRMGWGWREGDEDRGLGGRWGLEGGRLG